MPLHACVVGGWGGVGGSISNLCFLVVLLQPISFCILKKWANHSIWFIFPTHNTSLPAKTLPGKMHLPFFSSFAADMPKQKADENGTLGHQ